MTADKKQIKLNLNLETIKTLANISAKKGALISDVAETYLNRGISKEIEITSAERYNFSRIHINGSLDAILRLFGIKDLEGGLSDKCTVIIALLREKTIQEKSQMRNGIVEVSYFEILNEIKGFDIDLYKRIIVKMSKSGRIKNRYLNLYPE